MTKITRCATCGKSIVVSKTKRCNCGELHCAQCFTELPENKYGKKLCSHCYELIDYNFLELMNENVFQF